MLLVIHGHEREEYPKQMQQLFKLRYEHFVVRRQWSLPTRNGLDIDQYDNNTAIYFLSIDDSGKIEGTVRLNPTTNASLLADYYPHLIETGEPCRSPNLYEGTRYIIDPAIKSRDSIRRVKAVILSALVAWCMENDISQFQAVIDAKALATFVEVSLETRVLGLAHEFGGGPKVVGGGECLAFRWNITDTLLNDILAYGGLHQPLPQYVPVAAA